MSSKDTDKKILEFLESQDWPITTDDLAKNLKITWHTSQVHLMRMYAEGKVKYRKVGRQNQWWLVKKHKKEMG